ncbi:MAG: carboxylesterase family protein [Devosia sp.]
MTGRFLKAAFAVAVFAVCAATSAHAAPEATVDAGSLAGVDRAGVVQFLGVPFAAPPLGKQRWRAPQPVTPWTGIRSAGRMAARCSAPNSGDGPRLVNEDCLYLNVYAPAGAKPGEKLPVMVYFHGGGNYSGSPNVYDGSRMAVVAHAVVIIPAYRLGVFGFLAHPALSAEDQANASGGYGLLDQIAALKWINTNAAAFGGNPADVTVTGESSGGADVCGLMAAPAAKGLYRRTIVESGVCQFVQPLKAQEKQGSILAAALGCRDAACLRALPAAALIDKVGEMSTAAPFGTALQPEAPMTAFADGHFTHSPMIIGFTHDEAWSFNHGLYPMSEAQYEATVRRQFGAKAGKVLDLYPVADYPHIEYALGGLQTDQLFVCPALKIADSVSRYAPVSVYEFADRTVPPWKSLGATPSPIPPGYSPRASHTSELQYVYAYKGAVGPLNAAQSALADKMVKLWVAFGRKSRAWPAYAAEDRQVLELRLPEQGGITPLATVYDDHKCSYWNG